MDPQHILGASLSWAICGLLRVSFLPGCSRLCLHCTRDSETWCNLTLCFFPPVGVGGNHGRGLSVRLSSSMLSDAWLFIGSQGKLRAPVVESQVPAYTRPQAPAKQEAGDHEKSSTVKAFEPSAKAGLQPLPCGGLRLWAGPAKQRPKACLELKGSRVGWTGGRWIRGGTGTCDGQNLLPAETRLWTDPSSALEFSSFCPAFPHEV